MSSRPEDQQPIARTVGRRTPAPAGELPDRAARDAMDSLACRPTRTPKGVIRYASHDEMNRDRERWAVEAIVATCRARG
ncbi:MAG: hypothetical protein ACREUO_08375 [Burkholderiales bacterium]